MGAADATLAEALALLRTQWPTETEGVLNGKYSFWLGSGISRERYPDVPELIRRLLEKLQGSINHSTRHCPYREALGRVLALAGATPDVARPPSEWPNLPDIIRQLHDRYSEALDVEIRVNGTGKELYWDVLELQHVYGDPVPPDAEHRLLALLIEEGVVSELVTTNWDPLIEAASEACRPGGVQAIRIVACTAELAGSDDPGGARLLKIHGCARKALGNPATYKGFLVATKTHITRWCDSDLQRPFRELANTILREKFAFFIGLSGQDHNLQVACAAAFIGGKFPLGPSRVLFAKPAITAPEHGILKAIYQGYLDHANQIDARAALPLYAKPLLGSLYLLSLEKKISIFVNGAPSDFSSVHRSLVEHATRFIEQLLCARYDGIADPNTRWRRFADEVPSFISRFLRVYRHQEILPTPEACECLSTENPSEMVLNPIVPESDLPWLLLSIALVLEGDRRSLWKATGPSGDGGDYGQLAVSMTGNSVRVFFVIRSGTGLAKLRRQGFVDPGHPQRAVVVYPGERQPRQSTRRSSPGRRVPGRAPSVEPLEVWLKDIIENGQTVDELVKEFYRKLAA
jgi:hypothetical protein